MKPIFSESLSCEKFILTRQKNGKNKKWYGLRLDYIGDKEMCADNDEWIVDKLYPALIFENYSKVNEMLGAEFVDDQLRDLRKLFKVAVKLRWF